MKRTTKWVNEATVVGDGAVTISQMELISGKACFGKFEIGTFGNNPCKLSNLLISNN